MYLHSRCCSGEEKGGTKERKKEGQREGDTFLHLQRKYYATQAASRRTNTEELSSAEFMQCACTSILLTCARRSLA